VAAAICARASGSAHVQLWWNFKEFHSFLRLPNTPEHGLWKTTGNRTFITTFLDIEYNRDDQVSLYGTTQVEFGITLYPFGDQYETIFIFR